MNEYTYRFSSDGGAGQGCEKAYTKWGAARKARKRIIKENAFVTWCNISHVNKLEWNEATFR